MSLSAADVGSRVSVRRSLPGGGLGDVLGELTAWSKGVLTVRRKDGTVVAVPESTLVAGKTVPPRRVIARTAAEVGVDDLEEVAALGWPAPDTARVGSWLLRAARGWTWRANSVLPLGDPGLGPDAAIDATLAWYAERGLPARFHLPMPCAKALDARLADRGWPVAAEIGTVHVMVGDLPAAASAGTAHPPVTLSPSPSPGWLALYGRRDGSLPAIAHQVLTGGVAPVFAEVAVDGETLAIGRGAVGAGWIGITAMETRDDAQRRGLGRHVLARLMQHGRAGGARHVYLQVAAANRPAIALYTQLGLTVHHDYHYRISA